MLLSTADACRRMTSLHFMAAIVRPQRGGCELSTAGLHSHFLSTTFLSAPASNSTTAAWHAWQAVAAGINAARPPAAHRRMQHGPQELRASRPGRDQQSHHFSMTVRVARIRAVPPSLSDNFLSAPASSSKRTTSTLPEAPWGRNEPKNWGHIPCVLEFLLRYLNLKP